MLVPKRFENIDVRFRRGGAMDFREDFRDLLERKTVQELAHPDGVRALREMGRVIEDVAWDGVYTVGKAGGCGILFGNGRLPRQVDDGNLDVCIELAAGYCPLGRVSADVEEAWGFHAGELFKNNGERFGEGKVGVKMVEAKPAFLLLLGELGQPFIDRFPRPEVRESRRLVLADGFFKVLGATVADVLGKVHVDLRHFVGHEEKSDFTELEAQVVFVGIFVELDGAHAKSHLDKDLDSIERYVQFLGEFRNCYAFFAGAADGI